MGDRLGLTAPFKRGDYVLLDEDGIGRFLAYCIHDRSLCVVEEWFQGAWMIQEYRIETLESAPPISP